MEAVLRTAVGLLVLAVAWVGARADEEKVPLDKVPAAVTKAVTAKFPGAKLKQAEKEVEEGTTLYEIGLEYEGHNYDVTAKEDGTIVETEKEIAAADLPKPVADALKAKYPGAKYKKVEEVTKGGETKYEALLVPEGKKAREVVLDRQGKILEDEESDEG